MQDNVLGKVAQYPSVLTQNVFCVRVFGIIILCFTKKINDSKTAWRYDDFISSLSNE